MIEVEDLLFSLVKGFGSLPLDKFEAKYAEDVGETDDEKCIRVHLVRLPKLGLSTLFVLVGGLVVVEDAKGTWSLFETRERVEERERMSAWMRFVRGSWTRKVPTEDGVYPTKDLEGRRGVDRTLKRQNGRLVDVTRGFVGTGKVTEWRGYWWDQKYPPLPDSV